MGCPRSSDSSTLRAEETIHQSSHIIRIQLCLSRFLTRAFCHKECCYILTFGRYLILKGKGCKDKDNYTGSLLVMSQLLPTFHVLFSFKVVKPVLRLI